MYRNPSAGGAMTTKDEGTRGQVGSVIAVIEEGTRPLILCPCDTLQTECLRPECARLGQYQLCGHPVEAQPASILS